MVELSRHPLALTLPLLFTAMGDESWRVRKEAVAVLVAAEPVGDEAVEGLIRLLRSSDNAGLRNSAVESLERLGGVAVEPLCRYLDDPDHDLRKFVIDVLGSIRCASCVPLLVKALKDSDPNVRVAAAENLGKIGDTAAVPALLAVLAEDEIWLKFTVLDALALIGAPVPFSALAPLLSERLLRRAVYDCLGALGDHSALPLLFQGLEEKGRSPRESAGAALMRVRERLAEDEAHSLVDLPLKALKGTAAAEGLIVSLEGADPNNLEPLVRLAGILGDERATVPLLAVSRQEKLRKACLEAFRSIGAEAVPQLSCRYADAQDAERAVIASLLGELGSREALPLLLAALDEESPELRAACAGALGKLAVEGATGRLAELLDDAAPTVRQAALDALQRLTASDPEGVAELCARLVVSASSVSRRYAALLLAGLADGDRLSLLAKDEDPSVRRAAVASLARVKLPQVVGYLAMALSDEDAEVRLAAAQALSELGGPQVLDPLLLALGDPDPWVQTAALKGLSSLADPSALPGVKALLTRARGPVLIAALSALAAIGGEQESAAIEAALADGDEEVVEAAIGIMTGFGAGWIEEHWQALTAHPHWVVRRSFARAAAQLLGAQALPILDIALAKETDPLVRGEIVGLIGRL